TVPSATVLPPLLLLCHLRHFFFAPTATALICTLSLHDALPICAGGERAESGVCVTACAPTSIPGLCASRASSSSPSGRCVARTSSSRPAQVESPSSTARRSCSGNGNNRS